MKSWHGFLVPYIVESHDFGTFRKEGKKMRVDTFFKINKNIFSIRSAEAEFEGNYKRRIHKSWTPNDAEMSENAWDSWVGSFSKHHWEYHVPNRIYGYNS